MPVYIPSEIPTEVKTVRYIRQNCNRKNNDPCGSVLSGKTAHIPWVNTKHDIEEYEQDPTFLHRTKWNMGDTDQLIEYIEGIIKSYDEDLEKMNASAPMSVAPPLRMPTYVPSDTPTETKTVGYMRQNCNRKNNDPCGSVLRGKTAHIPWVHTKHDIEEYEQDPTFLQRTKYANIGAEFPVGSLVLIPDGKRGLIVRLSSEVKSGVMGSLCSAVSPRSCGHPLVRGKHRCVDCGQSVQEVFDPSDSQKLAAHLMKGHLIEPFWSLYRDVEIVGEANYDGVDGRSMAGIDSAGKWTHFWKLRD
jgi:hypothetical protein